jgi:hypothetical protein
MIADSPPPGFSLASCNWASVAWTVREYSNRLVDSAGRTLISGGFLDDATAAVIGNWRAAHSFPLNTLQIGLRERAHRFDETALISQRLKRLSSIAAKLRLLQSLKLSQMQDIGGCRAVVKSVRQVNQIAKDFKGSSVRHALVREDDYISNPKISGYRSYHLVYRYYSDRKKTYNGLKIEVQIRSALQHAWATAVETVGTFSSQALKSSQGSEDWLRFFTLMGSEIARRERTPWVPGAPSTANKLKQEIKQLANHLEVRRHLHAYRSALREIEEMGSNAHFFLLQLDPIESELLIRGYKSADLNTALADYLRSEENAIATGKRSDSVLVSVESAGSLRRAYPNYFLDTDLFLRAVEIATS